MNQKPNLITVLFLLLCFGGLVMLPKEVSAAVTEGLRLCGGVIIPSLFPFLVLSGLTVELGLAAALGRVLSPVMGRFLRITPAGTGAFTIGLLGGYPVGAGTVRQLWESGQCSREEAQYLLTFCNNCGPAFLMGIGGGQVFGSVKMGFLLWAAHVLGALTVACLLRGTRGQGENRHPATTPVRCVSFAAALTNSVQRGLRSALSICAYVVLFRVVLCFGEVTGLLTLAAGLPNGEALVGGLLEMSTGVTSIQRNVLGAAPLAAFIMGFGGLSVWCQTLAMLEGCGLDARPVFVGKLLHGGASALWTALLLQIFPQSVQTAAMGQAVMGNNPLSWLPMAVTGGCWGVFLLWLRLSVRLDGGKRVWYST